MTKKDALEQILCRETTSSSGCRITATGGAGDCDMRSGGVALRPCPGLPPTIEERIKGYRARNVADWVMYRKALSAAAETRGWAAHMYDA